MGYFIAKLKGLLVEEPKKAIISHKTMTTCKAFCTKFWGLLRFLLTFC